MSELRLVGCFEDSGSWGRGIGVEDCDSGGDGDRERNSGRFGRRDAIGRRGDKVGRRKAIGN